MNRARLPCPASSKPVKVPQLVTFLRDRRGGQPQTNLPLEDLRRLRLDTDVLQWLKAQGRGHLMRMNAVLRSYIEAPKVAVQEAPKVAVQVDPLSLPRRQDDPFADCVWARVETVPVDPSAARVVVTASFGTAEITPRGFGGRVRLGLRCAKLRLHADGGQIPHKGRWPEHETETIIRVELTEEHRQRRATSSRSGAKIAAGAAGPMGEATTEEDGHREEEETARRSFGVGEWKVRSGGSETSAYWEFRAINPKGEVHLRLVDREVAFFLPETHEAAISWGVEFMDADLRILGSEGLLAGRAGSDDTRKWGVVLAVVRKVLAADLRRAVGPLRPGGET